MHDWLIFMLIIIIRCLGMPYRHGFLTEKLREYLDKDGKEKNVYERATYNFHIRKSLKKALSDMIFVLEKLDKKQFDKISDDLYNDVVRLLIFFAKKCYVDTSELKYPFGRIKKYRKWVYITRSRAMDTMSKLAQDTLDKIYGKDKVYAYFMPRNEYLDLKEWFDKNREGVVRWRNIEE